MHANDGIDAQKLEEPETNTKQVLPDSASVDIEDIHAEIAKQLDDDYKKVLSVFREGTSTDCAEVQFEFLSKQLLNYTTDTSIDDLPKSNQLSHDEVAHRVIRRLYLRHAQIRLLKKLSYGHIEKLNEIQIAGNPPLREVSVGSKSLDGGDYREKPKNEGTKDSTLNTDKANSSLKSSDVTTTFLFSPELRAYRIAVTDIFVEKALTYLEIEANNYRRLGRTVNNGGISAIGVGILIALVQFYFTMDKIYDKVPSTDEIPIDWGSVISAFTVGFTFYGMVVLAAVGLWRYGKALMDQAERLLEKRHALREGRLFVHLRDGLVSIEQMEKAFNWNVTQPNAFGGMHTDAKAPWGAALSDVLQLPDIMKKYVKKINRVIKKRNHGAP